MVFPYLFYKNVKFSIVTVFGLSKFVIQKTQHNECLHRNCSVRMEIELCFGSWKLLRMCTSYIITYLLSYHRYTVATYPWKEANQMYTLILLNEWKCVSKCGIVERTKQNFTDCVRLLKRLLFIKDKIEIVENTEYRNSDNLFTDIFAILLLSYHYQLSFQTPSSYIHVTPPTLCNKICIGSIWKISTLLSHWNHISKFMLTLSSNWITT